MESSDAETGMADCGVGTIVWVRRRNGSWWPGKILGPDELSASHLMSPRSGTPVKLLGREDASVDWYNLEKSKRVKPFRCGEFDDCIERAEASQGMPPKKREKYARREDAILHALELENQLLEKKYGKSGTNGLKLLGKGGDNGKHAATDVDKRKGQSRNLNVDDKSRDLKHNNKLSSSNGSHKHAAAVGADSKSLLLEKRKRSQDMEPESVGKRRDRHRPLVQVLQSSAKLHQSKADAAAGEAVPGFDQVEIPKKDESLSFPTAAALSEDNATTGSNEDTETDSSGTESLISDTYDATMAALSDEAEHIEFIPKAFGRQGEEESNSEDDFSGDSLATVSKWQQKGKRNSRSLTKRKAPTNSSRWMMSDAYLETNMVGYNYGRGGVGGLLDMGGWDDQQKLGGGYCGRMLIDVEVGVQSGYQREHVPMISLMSKLNDKAIVGHPIPVEALQDGSSDIILSEFQIEDAAALQPWRTARRTAQCTRVSRLSTLEEEEEDEDEEEEEEEEDEDEEEEEDGSSSFHEYYDETGGGAAHRSSSSKARKWTAAKKPQRRTASSCTSQKIRTLSSIGGAHQQPQHQHQQIMMDLKAAGEQGIMKPESLPTTVACIPVKLVFSRLHEELLVAPRHQ